MIRISTLLSTMLMICFFAPAVAQDDPYYIPETFKAAVEKGTRTESGLPGENYWVNHANYKINVEVFPETGLVSGSAEIKYRNNSPDSLDYIVVRLYQDIYKKGNSRQFGIGASNITDGVIISRLKVDGVEFDPSSRKVYRSATNMYITLDSPLPPQTHTTISINWSFKMPQKHWIRFGQYSEKHMFVAYWYPQVAVYDDIDGWDRIEYAGMVEFYNDVSDFEVNITVPGNYCIWGTGELLNHSDVFSTEVLKKYQKAVSSNEVVQIIRHEDYAGNSVLKPAEKHTWEFKARSVPDFAFAVSSGSAWDAVSVVVDRKTGRRALISSVYPDSAVHYQDVALIARNAVDYMSNQLPGYPFPYPQTTVFANGRKSGGMEFPMIANDGAPDDYADLMGLTFHEILHNYFPFYMGTNERKYAFMDEGWARYFPKGFLEVYEPDDKYFQRSIAQYEDFAGQENDMPPMIPTYIFNDYQTQRIAAYTRPAVAYFVLHETLGDELFKACLLEYMNRWMGKHPMPYDFFNTFNDVADEDLSWFWKPWFFDRGLPDLAIQELTPENVLLIRKNGNIPVPVELQVIFEDGTEKQISKNTRVWADGKKVLAIQLSSHSTVKEINLGNDLIPDSHRKDNHWVAD